MSQQQTTTGTMFTASAVVAITLLAGVALTLLGAIAGITNSTAVVAGGGSVLNVDAIPAHARHLASWVIRAGSICPEVTPPMIAAQIEQESNWNPDAVAHNPPERGGDAMGIAQFQAATWAGWGEDANGNGTNSPWDPEDAIWAQGRLMCDLVEWAKGLLATGALQGDPVDLALAAYFCGRGCILAAGGVPAGGLAAEYPAQVRARVATSGLAPSVPAGEWTLPLPPGSYELTSGFGMRWGRLHAGVDFAAPVGTPIYAAADGAVLDAGCTSPRCDIPGSAQMPGCDPLTAPTEPDLVGLFPFRRSGRVVAPVDVCRAEGKRRVGGSSLRDLLREGRWEVPAVGAVVVGEVPSLPFLVVDGAGAAVEPVSRYLRDLMLSDRSQLTVRSYAMDLLRWWRLLEVLEVTWDVATTDEVAVLVGWLRNAPNPQRRGRNGFPGGVNVKTGKTTLGAGYVPSTINHALSVLSGFYAFHAHYGRGPVVNPVPPQARRRAVLAHRSPLEPVARLPRAPLRQRTSVQSPRVIADPLWQELFEAMTCVRDRALLACYVSSGARASELLGMHAEHVDWAGQRLWVLTKGTRLLEPVPASPLAFTLLALYFEQDGAPPVGQPVWRTRRGQCRPLTYWAARRILQRANARLGTNWSLHDTRHTAATRMVNDPALTLPEVQTVMRHAHLATTQRYLGVDLEDLVAKMQRHYQRPAQPQPMTAVGYAPEDVATVFGG